MWLPADLGRMMKPIRSYVAPRRPRKNDEAVESLIRNPSSKTDFRPIGNQQVITNLMFLLEKQNVSTCETSNETIASKFFKSVCFELSFGLFKGDMLLSMYRRCIAGTSIHCVIHSYTMICRDNVGMYRQNLIFKYYFNALTN